MVDQFDLLEATAARDAGLAHVIANSPVWLDRSLAYVASLPNGWTGIAEDIRRLLVKEIGPPHHSNAYGALTREALNRGLIVPTGRRLPMRAKTSHARRTDEYRRVKGVV